MATTSLWHIEGRLKDLIDYVENLEKTAAKTPELQDLYNVFSYVQRTETTQEGEYVTAINCLKETALRQMILTKKHYGKADGYIAWHGYQSFKPEEVTPQLAHEIGVKLAKEMWGDRFEIIVTTHVETVVKLSLKKDTPKIEVTMEPDEESNYTPEEKATYQKIKDYVKNKYGVNVHTSYIAQVKRMCGLDMGENYNKSKKKNPEVKQCPQEKVEYIKDALRYFNEI